MQANIIDLFCGVGGLNFGLKKTGLLNMIIDIDSSCKYAYETNIQVDFINKNIKDTLASEITNHFNDSKTSINTCRLCPLSNLFTIYTTI